MCIFIVKSNTVEDCRLDIYPARIPFYPWNLYRYATFQTRGEYHVACGSSLYPTLTYFYKNFPFIFLFIISLKSGLSNISQYSFCLCPSNLEDFQKWDRLVHRIYATDSSKHHGVKLICTLYIFQVYNKYI